MYHLNILKILIIGFSLALGLVLGSGYDTPAGAVKIRQFERYDHPRTLDLLPTQQAENSHLSAFYPCGPHTGKELIIEKVELNDLTDYRIVRYDITGMLDTDFTEHVDPMFNSLFDRCEPVRIAIQSNGKAILIFKNERNEDSQLIAIRLNPDGSLDHGFGNSGLVYLNPVSTRKIDAILDISDTDNGKILISLGFSSGQQMNLGSIFILNDEGEHLEIVALKNDLESFRPMAHDPDIY